MKIKLQDTVIGSEYWFTGSSGPFLDKASAFRSSRLLEQKSYFRRIFHIVRVHPETRDMPLGVISYGLSSGPVFKILEKFPAEPSRDGIWDD